MLLWADGFDHYGTDENNMLDGVYAAAAAALSTGQVATGTHALHINTANAGSGDFNGVRKVLPASTDKIGVMARLYYPVLPANNGQSIPFTFFSSSTGRSEVSVYLGANGELYFCRGSGFGFSSFGERTYITETEPLITASAYNHVEIQIYFHATLGWIRVAVNGVHRFEATELNTQFTSTSIASVANHNFTSFNGAAWNHYMDDYIIYDFTGNSAVETDFCPTVDGTGKATSYIGELECHYLAPTADTAEADWTKSTGTDGYALIDEVDPNDADYIQSATAGDLSEFAMQDLPEEITYVRGLMVLGRLSKIDSGVANVKYGMKSVAAVSDAAARPITVEPTYWWDFINVDPNTSARWTRASLNAAWVRITRQD